MAAVIWRACRYIVGTSKIRFSFKLNNRSFSHQSEPFTKDPPLVGTSNFCELVQEDSFVDKTMLIKNFIESRAKSILITSPRRFGKSTNMDMIKTFLEIEVDEIGNQKTLEARANYKLFTDKRLQISQHQDFIKKYLGQYPVISVSFANVKSGSYDEILDEIKDEISYTFEQHKYLYKLDLIEAINDYNEINKDNADTNKNMKSLERFVDAKGIKLSEETIRFRKFYTNSSKDSTTETEIKGSLKFLSRVLHTYFNKNVYLLVDEYDAPINSIICSNIKGDIKRVNTLVHSVLGNVIKGNKYIERGLMTGISLLAKNSDSSSLNNVSVYKFLDNHKYAQYYGFTDKEVSLLTTDDLIQRLVENKMQQSTELNISNMKSIIREDIKDYYNGYFIVGQDTEIYNPWSIMKCLESGIVQNYWCTSGTINELKELFKHQRVQEKFNELITDEGTDIKFVDNPAISDIHILHRLINCYEQDITATHINLFFSYIFQMGYLTPIRKQNDIPTPTSVSIKKYKIPNKEIEQEFTRHAIDYFISTYKLSEQDFGDTVNRLNSVITDFNESNLHEKITNFQDSLQKLFQTLDFSKMQSPETGAHANESLLHTIAGIIVIQTKASKFGTEVMYSAGLDKGRPDIVASYQDLGLVIELKFNGSADKALKQIKDKKYNNIFSTATRIKSILDIGINLTSDRVISIKHDLSNNSITE